LYNIATCDAGLFSETFLYKNYFFAINKNYYQQYKAVSEKEKRRFAHEKLGCFFSFGRFFSGRRIFCFWSSRGPQ
jgi:hypothetical protein